MNEATKLKKLKTFLRIWGALMVLVMSTNSLGFLFRITAFNPGGKYHWLTWDDVYGHVGPMIFVIYLVWAVYLFKAANNPMEYRTFLNFTMWANIAHGLLMVPMAFNNEMYHSKFLTDIPFLLLLSLGICLWRPEAPEKEIETSLNIAREV